MKTMLHPATQVPVKSGWRFLILDDTTVVVKHVSLLEAQVARLRGPGPKLPGGVWGGDTPPPISRKLASSGK